MNLKNCFYVWQFFRRTNLECKFQVWLMIAWPTQRWLWYHNMISYFTYLESRNLRLGTPPLHIKDHFFSFPKQNVLSLKSGQGETPYCLITNWDISNNLIISKDFICRVKSMYLKSNNQIFEQLSLFWNCVHTAVVPQQGAAVLIGKCGSTLLWTAGFR